MRTALVVGGTGATGPGIVAALRGRGYEVTVYHRGMHELAEVGDLEHIHGNPRSQPSVARDLRGRSWDVAVATYGSIGSIAKELRGRTEHLVAISRLAPARSAPAIPMFEEDVPDDPQDVPTGLRTIAPRVANAERAVLDGDAAGHFVGTVVRYPYVYGPRAALALECLILKRVLDGRTRWITQGCGLAIDGRCASVNAVRLIGLVLDQPDVASGEVYHAADTHQYTLREWVAMIADSAGHEFEFVDIPPSVASWGAPAAPVVTEATSAPCPPEVGLAHTFVSNEKARIELGYADVVTPREWIDRVVDECLSRPSTLYEHRSDFDYAAEDRLLSFWDRVVADAPADDLPSFNGNAQPIGRIAPC
jgi:nucleoside-diphosphate-sugar epimerase